MKVDLPKVNAKRFSLGGDRFYEVDGAIYPSVTTVLQVVAKGGLLVWTRKTAVEATCEAVRYHLERGLTIDEALEQASRAGLSQPQRLRDAAAVSGSGFHQSLAEVLSGLSKLPPGANIPQLKAARSFLWRHKLQSLAAEYTVVSHKYGYAGTCDLVALGPKGLVVIDWKTGGIYDDHALQIGAYAMGINEMTGKQVTEGFIIGLRLMDGHYWPEPKRVNLSLAWEGFVGALKLWNALRGKLFHEG